MVKYLKSLWNWPLKKINNFLCRMDGHGCVQTIEVYSKHLVAKNYKGSSLKKLSKCKPYNQLIVNGKFKCGLCGQVFLGVIVTDNEKCTIYDRA